MKELELIIKEMERTYSEKIKSLEAMQASAGSINAQNKENLGDFQIDLVQGIEKALHEQKMELMRLLGQHFVFGRCGGGTEFGGSEYERETPEKMRDTESPNIRF